MASRTTGGKSYAIGPMTARVVAGRYEVSGLRLHEALFDLYDALDRRLNTTIGFRAALGQVVTRRPLVERLQQILRSLRTFNHPNVVEINDCFQEVSQLYITQEHIQGLSVAEWVELRGERRFAVEEGLAIGVVLCQALAAGHAGGLVHGGINPEGVRFAEPLRENELLGSIQLKAGRLFVGNKAVTPKFMNYGLGPIEAAVGSTRKSYGLHIAKEDEFLPPEQQTGLSPEPRSDFYSLGCLIHFCITGQPPAAASTRFSREGTGGAGAGGGALTPGLPDPLIPVLTKALQRTPAERYSHAEEMAEALQSVLDYLATHPISETIPAEPTPDGAPPQSKPPEPTPINRTPTPFDRTPAPSERSPASERQRSQKKSPSPSRTSDPTPSPGSVTPPGPARRNRTPRETPPLTAPHPTGAGASPSSHRPSPESGLLPKVERDPRWRPPLRASAREEETPQPSGKPSPVPGTPPTPKTPPSPPPVSRTLSAPVTPVAAAPPTEGLPPRLARTVTPLAILPEMALVPKGTYRMGSEDVDDGQPVHPCTIDSLYMAVHPVTNEEYRCFVLTEGHPPPHPQTDQYTIWDGTRFAHELARRPVVHVSWDDATAYCRWLTELTGSTFRLPTEAEWERAARGGLEDKRYPWGDEEPTERAAFDLLWTGPTVIPEVASYDANQYGLFDMSGLVWEWCRDFYHRRYYELPEATVPNPVNDAPSIQRVQRGGAWLTGARSLRCAHRGKHRPDSATVGFGFRIVREP